MIKCSLQCGETSQVFWVGQRSVFVGREPGVDLLVDDESVSRRHAEFYLSDDDKIMLADLGSLNGTFVNGAKVSKAVLFSDDVLKVGGATFRFFRLDQASPRIQAEAILAALRKSLENQVPTGCSLNYEACSAVFEISIRAGLEEVSVVSQFVKDLDSHPERYYKGFEAFQAKCAEGILQQVEEALSGKLPFGCSFDRSPCLTYLLDGVKKGKDPQELVTAFLSEVKANPRRYLNGLPDPQNAYEFRSGAPSYPSRSECRR
jgi:FHA domain